MNPTAMAEPVVSKIGLYGMCETAKILGVHRNTLNNLIGKKLITPEISKINSRRVFRGKEILRFWHFRLTTNKIK